MKQNRKAQSALEFLTTYGWAFLVILIMIGALAYFGILNPSRYLPERCTATPGISCNEFEISGAANDEINVRAVLTNNLGSGIEIKGVTLVSNLGPDAGGADAVPGTDRDAANDASTASACQLVGPAVSFGPDASIDIACLQETVVGTTAPTAGTKQKALIEVTYLPAGKTIDKTFEVEVFGAIIT
jgi:hypothetical protein